MTQKNKILKLLKQRGEKGAMVYEFMMPKPQGLGIAQYNARIYDLRREGYTIDSDGKGKFILVGEPKKVEYEWVVDNNTNTPRKVIKQ